MMQIVMNREEYDRWNSTDQPIWKFIEKRLSQDSGCVIIPIPDDEEPEWDGICRCNSDEDNPCVCN